MAGIEFEHSVEKVSFFSPLAGMELAEQTIEVRRDPLTGMTAVASSELAAKEEMFYGTTDWQHADDLAASSREGCFFCPEKVLEATPRYPEHVLPGGRLRHGRALVFPNLFPLAALHAVVTYPERHYLRPSEFEPELLAEGFGAALEFGRHAETAYGDLEHLELCCNHMLPAGASLVHPHFQMFGGAAVPWLLRSQWERAAAFCERWGVSYWQALVDEETARGERFIDSHGGCTWLAAYAPAGGREVMAVLPGRARLTALDDGELAELSRGLSKVLAWYERGGLSAFNFTLGGGPLGGDAGTHAVVLRVIARSAFKADYRADDYFLQKQLGGELFFSTPEQLAETLRAEFRAA
jgi:galactose-1-phosphate uridylyltransferase